MKLSIFTVIIIALLWVVMAMKGEKVTIKKVDNLRGFKKISKGIYDVYGDSYPYKDIYNPYKSYDGYLNGQSTSYIAMDKGRLLGHVALIGDKNKNICEMATAFVNPKYRGKGTLTELVKKIISECSDSSNVGVYVNSVCGHTYSQNVVYKLGFNECAIMLGKMVALDFKNIDGKWDERETLVTAFKYLKAVDEKHMFLCSKHKKIVEEIYNGLGVKVSFIEDKSKDVMHYLNSTINIEKFEDRSAFISIIEFGGDIIKVIINALNKLIEEGIKSIIVTMSLYERATKHISIELENYGFFFAGVLPGDAKDDLLLVQYITENTDYDNIHLLTDKGKGLLSYIRKENCYANERKDVNEF